MENNHYKTRDLYEAAFIYAQKGETFSCLEPNGRDFLFVFENPNECRSLASKYYSTEGLVSGKHFADAIKTLKDLIFNRLRERQTYDVR